MTRTVRIKTIDSGLVGDLLIRKLNTRWLSSYCYYLSSEWGHNDYCRWWFSRAQYFMRTEATSVQRVVVNDYGTNGERGRIKRESRTGRLRTRNIVFTSIIPSLRLELAFVPDDSDDPAGSFSFLFQYTDQMAIRFMPKTGRSINCLRFDKDVLNVILKHTSGFLHLKK